MDNDEKLRLIEVYCRQVIETEDEVGYDVRGIAEHVIGIITATNPA